MDQPDKLLKVPGPQFPHLETGDDKWGFLNHLQLNTEMYSAASIGISGHGSVTLRVYSPT